MEKLLRCSKCKEFKPCEQYNRYSTIARGYSYACKQCTKLYTSREDVRDRRNKYHKIYDKVNTEKRRQYRLKNVKRARLRSREHNLKSVFGLTLEDYNKMLENQNDSCAICKKPSYMNGNRYLAVDHCHESGKVRGLLCNTCNLSLGKFGDSIEILENAINYLKMNKMS